MVENSLIANGPLFKPWLEYQTVIGHLNNEFFIYPLLAMHSLLVTLNVTEYLIGINQRLNSLYTVNANINYIILMKSKL